LPDQARLPGPVRDNLPIRDSVLITRPQPGADETAARVAALGWQPVVAPLLEIHRLNRPLPAAKSVQAVLVASGNALPGLARRYRRLPLLAVGDATAARAREAGFTQVHSAGADATALAALAERSCDSAGAPLLLAAGRGQSLGLATALRERGFRVIRRAVYASVPVTTLPSAAANAAQSGRLRAILFFSAETARQFARLLTRAGLRETVAGVDACAIGAPAAAAIQELPWRRVLRAAHPTQDAMLALLS
jgi:uroporphyrinogen-III synthase